MISSLLQVSVATRLRCGGIFSNHFTTYRVAQKIVHFLTHHIFGTVEDKMKQIAPKCSQSFWE